METFDACVFVFTGLTTGMAIGLAIRTRQIRNLQSEIIWEGIKYSKLADAYTDCLTEKYTKERDANSITTIKKKAGRPKGSKNKPKQDVKPVTRKYTRKSSK